MPYSPALEVSATFLSENPDLPGVDKELVDSLTDERQALHREIDKLRGEVDHFKSSLEDLWRRSSTMKVAYELTSVFIHRGHSPSFGHYFFYSRNLPHKPDEWFKYNDESVKVVHKDEVLADTTGSTANPYLVRGFFWYFLSLLLMLHA